MAKMILPFLLVGLAATSSAPAQSIERADAPIIGIWHNPKDTVAVRTGPCGEHLCGWVVRASDKAKRDAAKRGGPPLVGMTLLRDYTRDDADKWVGTLFVPDMGRTVSSTITMIDADTISVRGCILGGLVCKTQVWRRE